LYSWGLLLVFSFALISFKVFTFDLLVAELGTELFEDWVGILSSCCPGPIAFDNYGPTQLIEEDGASRVTVPVLTTVQAREVNVDPTLSLTHFVPDMAPFYSFGFFKFKGEFV
jgi:hypothetical protein